MYENEFEKEDSLRDRLPEVGEIVDSKKRTFTLIEIIGVGGYGCVFRVSCSATKRCFALKAELYSKTVIKNEIVVMKTAAMNNCTHMCELIDYGRVGKQFMYVVMTLLGEDLYRLRRDRNSQCFTMTTVIRAARQTLQGIEELHKCGFVSRDVKPSNFATGSAVDNLTQHIFMFDFGLAKRYRRNGVVLGSRGRVGWRGTARYGSVNAHRKQDLGRRDDLESWLYMVIEFTNGSLPWRFVHDRTEVGILKEACRFTLRHKLLKNCPPQFDELLTSIDFLDFDTPPPYQQFYTALDEVLSSHPVCSDSPYDWEVTEEMVSASMSNDSTEKYTQIETLNTQTPAKIRATPHKLKPLTTDRTN